MYEYVHAYVCVHCDYACVSVSVHMNERVCMCEDACVCA